MSARVPRRLPAVLGAVAFCVGCAAQKPEPSLPAPEHTPVVHTASAAPPVELAVSAPREPEPQSAAPFRVGHLEVRTLAPALFDAAHAAPARVESVPYERFRLLATLQVGYSHLSMLDLSADETQLLLVLHGLTGTHNDLSTPLGGCRGKEVPGHTVSYAQLASAYR